MDVVIQPASVNDAAAIAEVHVASMRASHQGLLPEAALRIVLDPPEAEKRALGWKRWLELSRTSTLVGRVDGAVVGFCALRPVHDDSARGAAEEIMAFYVLPSHWRHGIGRLLAEQALSEARERGFEEAVLWVLEPNERARRFYESVSFGPDGGRRIFFERPGASLYEVRYRCDLGHAAAEL